MNEELIPIEFKLDEEEKREKRRKRRREKKERKIQKSGGDVLIFIIFFVCKFQLKQPKSLETHKMDKLT